MSVRYEAAGSGRDGPRRAITVIDGALFTLAGVAAPLEPLPASFAAVHVGHREPTPRLPPIQAMACWATARGRKGRPVRARRT